MALTITTEPYSITAAQLIAQEGQPPVPVSDCWRWCLQAADADAVTTPGGYAEVVITIPVTATIPTNGTEVVIWGHTFTVDDSTPFTGTSFEVETSGIATVLNFTAMIQANLFFNDAVTIVVTTPSDFVVTLTWRECREQARFVSEDMVFTAIDDLGGSGAFTNGTSPVYVDGYKIVTRLGLYTGGVFVPLSPKVGLTTDQQCDTVGEVCVDYVADAETMLHTLLPELTSTSIITGADNANSLLRLFSLEYGWVYRQDCQAKSGTIIKSGIVMGINAAFEIDDEFQMRRYWYGHPDGYPTDQSVSNFLTTVPSNSKLCLDSFAWLWFLNSWQDDFAPYDLWANFLLYGQNGFTESFEVKIMDDTTGDNLMQRPVCFNVSPAYVLANAPTLTSANLSGYKVSVYGKDTGDPLFLATEEKFFTVGHCCDEYTDLYVLTPPGGFATQPIEVLERQVIKDGQEINLQVPCGGERTARAKYGGRTMVNLRSYEKIDFRFFLANNLENVRWAKHVRQSPQTMIKTWGEGLFGQVGPAANPNAKADPFAKKFIIDPSSVTTFVVAQGIEFKATGYMADVPTQKGNEP